MLYRDLVETDLEGIADILIDNLDEDEDSHVILLEGDIGAGKTTLVKYLAKKLGIKRTVQSPTFNLMREYEIPADRIDTKFKNRRINNLVHIDAYRFENKDESKVLNLKNKLNQSLVVIEWPNLMHIPGYNLVVKIRKW
jgi:tRNA threonylcarbamoyladenosine biosynthesis protein TsaE